MEGGHENHLNNRNLFKIVNLDIEFRIFGNAKMWPSVDTTC